MSYLVANDNQRWSVVLGIKIVAKSSAYKAMPLVFMTRGERVVRSWEFIPALSSCL